MQTNTHNDELQKRLAFFEDQCRARGLRVTNQRREIFRAVAASCEHPSAEKVFLAVRKNMPNVSLDTVYRTLASLEEMDLLMRVGLSSKARFDGDLRPHCHFVCTNCGEVYDVFLKDGESLPLPAGMAHWGDVKQINLQVRGLCNKCRGNK
ncbi:Fur family transcriptional regulator [Candidatus Avelusimicrobium fimicolum]|uniref:Fur family transcriptional regulator n=1 Tax=Candidatus Avelusimicrobium fimicolum TaxID=3416216 RepID=UPI003D0C39C7